MVPPGPGCPQRLHVAQHSVPEVGKELTSLWLLAVHTYKIIMIWVVQLST